MKWKITYYNKSVEIEILNLPNTLLARYIRMTEIMRDYGPNIGMPHTKALGDSLFELRLKGKEGISRLFYCVVIKREIMFLHSIIKKTQKIPGKELKLVKKRMKEVEK